MSYQTAQQHMSTAARAARSAMQSCAAPMAATAMSVSLIKTDRILGLFLLLVVIVISMLLLSSGSEGG